MQPVPEARNDLVGSMKVNTQLATSTTAVQAFTVARYLALIFSSAVGCWILDFAVKVVGSLSGSLGRRLLMYALLQ